MTLGHALQAALSRWESEGGAGSDRAPGPARCDGKALQGRAWAQTELVQLRVRVIALENLIVSMLAQAPVQHLAGAREMADYISPRPGFTAHPMTLHAADEMRSVVGRAHATSRRLANS